ncbi:MAG: hypothetical protein QY322_01635 [bacterium]|nr:MAG: hypothetical protein QY322_01635 [bacterium]
MSFITLVWIYASTGNLFIKNLGKRIPSISVYGISTLIGFGIINNILLIVGIIWRFDQTTVLTTHAIFLLISFFRPPITLLDVKKLVTYIGNSWRKNLLPYFFLALSSVILGSLYLSALQPPHSPDELHYHLPQIRQILEEKGVDIHFGGHFFYGNIPKLVEVSFAGVSTLFDYNFTHLVNLSIFIAFLVVVFGIINRKFGLFTASLSTMLLLMFDDLTWNATTGYIDTATLSFEISSLIILTYLLTTKDKIEKYVYIIPGLLMGLGLASKYSPAPTLLYMGVLMLIFRKKIIYFINFGLGVFIFGSFWYMKNLLLYLNPFYPLYLGHKNVPEDLYKSLVDAIQEFGPKTLNYFLKIVSRYLTTNGTLVYLSIFIAPFGLIEWKKNKFVLILSLYYVLYSAYWFFLGTHQIRFLAPALVVAILITSYLVSKINQKIIFCISTLAFSILFILGQPWYSFWNTKLRVNERQYAVGNLTESQFLNRHFGCQYQVIKYLDDNNIVGSVIDNWSVWHAPSVSFYATKNQFQTYSTTTLKSEQQIKQEINDGNISFIYFNSKVRQKHLLNDDSIVVRTRDEKLPVENYLLKNSKLEFNESDCYLYRIDLNNVVTDKLIN